MIARPLLSCAALSLMLSACAENGQGYPSLNKRPVEAQVGDTASPPAAQAGAETERTLGPDLAAQIAGLVRQAEAGGAAFDTVYGEVAGRIRVSAGAAVSSENWVAAHVSLSRLEQARYGSVYALASLDTLYADRMKAVAEGTASGGVAEIEAARDPVLAMVDAQNRRVDELKAVLAEP